VRQSLAIAPTHASRAGIDEILSALYEKLTVKP